MPKKSATAGGGRSSGLNKKLILRSSLWTFAGFGLGQALRLASNLILTRLLLPEAFGLAALAVIFMTGLALFTDIGLGASIIQNKRGEEPNFLNTAWTLKVIRGVFIGLCTCLIAAPLAWFYDEPLILPILLVLALSPVFSGFTSNALDLASRKLWVGRVTVLDLACRVAGLTAMVTWAWLSPTVWAIVAGNVFSAFLRAAASHAVFPGWRTHFRWDASAVREIVHFGKWIFLTSALTFVASQIDRLTLAKLVPLDLVGIYSIGFMWAMLPLELVQAWSGRVLFPLASEILRDPAADRGQLTRYRRRFVWAAAIGVGCFGGIATPLFHLLYPPAFWPGATFFSLILIGSGLKILDDLYRPLNLALGQPKFTSIGSGMALLIFLVTVYPLFKLYSAHGIALAYSISQFGTYVASAAGLRKSGLAEIRIDGAAVLVAIAIWAILQLLFRSTGIEFPS
jgi:O-antigen/teichoic acid export membrane protein